MYVDKAKRMKEMEKEKHGCGVRFLISLSTIKPSMKSRGESLSHSRKRIAVDHVMGQLGVSQRKACRVIGQHRSTHRKPKTPRCNEDALTSALIVLA